MIAPRRVPAQAWPEGDGAHGEVGVRAPDVTSASSGADAPRAPGQRAADAGEPTVLLERTERSERRALWTATIAGALVAVVFGTSLATYLMLRARDGGASRARITRTLAP